MVYVGYDKYRLHKTELIWRFMIRLTGKGTCSLCVTSLTSKWFILFYTYMSSSGHNTPARHKRVKQALSNNFSFHFLSIYDTRYRPLRKYGMRRCCWPRSRCPTFSTPQTMQCHPNNNPSLSGVHSPRAAASGLFIRKWTRQVSPTSPTWHLPDRSRGAPDAFTCLFQLLFVIGNKEELRHDVRGRIRVAGSEKLLLRSFVEHGTQ
jgi:hypothetical protein